MSSLTYLAILPDCAPNAGDPTHTVMLDKALEGLIAAYNVSPFSLELYLRAILENEKLKGLLPPDGGGMKALRVLATEVEKNPRRHYWIDAKTLNALLGEK